MGAGRASSVAVAAVAGAVLALTLLVTWSASVGPREVLAGDGPVIHPLDTDRVPAEPRSTGPTSSPTRADASSQEAGDGHALLEPVFAVLGYAATIGLLWLLVLAGRGTWRGWREQRRRLPPPPVEFDVVEAPRRVAEEIARDARHQRAMLLDGTPRNGIVACWHRFEEQAAAAGVVRQDWETSGEFTLRVLDLVDAESTQVSRLARLYREARFSDHALDESARTAALEALDAIHAQLPVRSPAP